MMNFARDQHLAKLRWEVHRTGGDVRVADAEHQHHAALRGDEHRHSLRRLPPAPEGDTPRARRPQITSLLLCRQRLADCGIAARLSNMIWWPN